MRFRPALLAVLVLVGCWASVAEPAGAQPAASESSEQGKTLVRDAYQQSRTASTPEEFSKIIEICQQAQAEPLSAELQQYLKKLLAWAHNQRGEKVAEQAANLMDEGDPSQADELDEQALADFEQAVSLDPDNWKALHNRGVSYALSGRYEDAVADFSRVVELNPNYANAWFNRAEIRLELGQFDESLEDYSQAIRLRPEDAGAYTSRGHAYFQQGDYERAIADYNRAVQLNPSSAVAYANRGDAYQSLRNWEQAAQDYRQAVQLDNDLARAYQSAAWLMATCPDARFRNAGLALQSAQRALQLSETPDFRSLDTLAAAHAAAGQFPQAVATVAQAIEQAPEEEREALRQREALYRAGKPYHQSAQ